jgi:hypothetical protein
VLDCDGDFVFEPGPSNRTAEFISRTRFTLVEAIYRALQTSEDHRGENTEPGFEGIKKLLAELFSENAKARPGAPDSASAEEAVL